MCRRLFRSAEYRELSFLLRAVKLATFIKNVGIWALPGHFVTSSLLLPCLPLFLSTFVNICRLRSGGALSVLYWYNWGPRPYEAVRVFKGWSYSGTSFTNECFLCLMTLSCTPSFFAFPCAVERTRKSGYHSLGCIQDMYFWLYQLRCFDKQKIMDSCAIVTKWNI